MRLFRCLIGPPLAVLSVLAIAESPYEVTGLHVGLMLTEAVAQAEKLGGTCWVAPARRQEGVQTAHCEYQVCATDERDSDCEQPAPKSPGPTIGSQAILHIGMEASGEIPAVTRIVVSYEGSSAAVTEHLSREFGEPISDESTTKATSWTHSHRLHWQRGQYRIGLLHPSRLIILTADMEQQESAPAAR